MCSRHLEGGGTLGFYNMGLFEFNACDKNNKWPQNAEGPEHRLLTRMQKEVCTRGARKSAFSGQKGEISTDVPLVTQRPK